jgi:archaeal flagellar protein FlaI
MKFPSFKSKSPEEGDAAGTSDSDSASTVAEAQSSQQQQGPPEPQEQQQPDAGAREQGKEKKKGFFSRGSKSKEEKKQDAKEGPVAPVEKKAKKSRGFFGRGKEKFPEEPAPTELVHIEGERVLVPSYEDIDKYDSIVYPVREPYQYTGLRRENGELSYYDIEPQLTANERRILKKTAEAYDMLVNVGTVLTSVEDKMQFLDDAFRDIMKIYSIKLTDLEYRRILYYIERDYVGYGKIDTLVRDRLIEDISCNGPNAPVYVYHRFFESVKTNVVFEEVELNNFILRLAQLSGRHISILQPIRDAALPDGSRINMTLGKEVTKKGSTFTIRKFRSEPISPVEIMLLHTSDSRIFAFLWILIEYGRSLLISGGTAAGKTTLLNAISMLIKPENKIVSVEDTPEINLAHNNWIQAVTRVGFGESGGGVSGVSGISGVSGGGGRSAGDIRLYDLLIAALRQRPDFIIVGEVRGEEAYTLFQAISVGHATMGTIHAASMPELLARAESQPMNVPRVLIANLDIVIFLAAVRKGDEKVRRIREIVEILGVSPASKELITNVVFRWDPTSDFYEFTGRSFQLEKISKSTGISMEKLNQELANRVELLERMSTEGIVNYRAVTDIVRQYYLDRAAVMKTKDLRTLVNMTVESAPIGWGGKGGEKM